LPVILVWCRLHARSSAKFQAMGSWSCSNLRRWLQQKFLQILELLMVWHGLG
jgi:hypothetical protein